MNIINKYLICALLGSASLLLAGCGGGGSGSNSNNGNGGNGTQGGESGPTTCFAAPDESTRLPAQSGVLPNQVWHDYSYDANSPYQIYGYNNPNPLHVKKITVYNNYTAPIYPVIFSPTPFTGSDGGQKRISRIFVGKPSCSDPNSFYAGLPAGGSAVVYVPKQMWDAGHIKIFTELPPMLQEDVGRAIEKPIFTVDKLANSPNYGYLLYTSGTADDFRQEFPFQLAEYTFESTCSTDSPNCATPLSDLLTVDYDISAVDQLFLPEALQESTGSRGYVGTTMNVADFQAHLYDFIQGGGQFSYDNRFGWPYYYGSEGLLGYKSRLIKIPMGYNVMNSIMFPSPPPYNNAIPTNLVVFDKNAQKFINNASSFNTILSNIVNRWSTFWQLGALACAGQGTPAFCNDYAQTMNFLYANIVNACKFSLTQLGLNPAECLTPNQPRSVLTDADKVKAFMGYTPIATTFSPLYPAVDLNNICTTENGSNPPKDATFYSNCLRDALKSVLRGVPYPYWKYSTQYYPPIGSVYNLNPVVWLVHQSLGLSEYAFSVDDDIGNQELVGNGITLTVGGANGLKSANAYDPRKAQIIAFPAGFWKGTVSSSPVCLPEKVGACDLNIQSGAYDSVTVALTSIANPAQFLNFTITKGAKVACNINGLPSYDYEPLVITNCSSNLKNCSAGLLPVNFNNPGKSCSQTVVISAPTP